MSGAGAATDEKVARQDEQKIARRIEQFRRKCGVHGEEALRFAYHAALPVALNPEFLHLLRINFFVDIERPLPYEVEFEFLLSSLCRQIDEGLYEIERDVRLVLLEGLAREFGQERMREVAMLLWEYVERQEPWAEQVGLERAQQLTVLNFLDSAQAKGWLDTTNNGQQVGTFQREWLVAMGFEVEQASSFLESMRSISLAIKPEWQEVLRLAFEENLQDQAIAKRMSVQLGTVQHYWIKLFNALAIEPEKNRKEGKNPRILCKRRAVEEGLISNNNLTILITEPNSVNLESAINLLQSHYPTADLITAQSSEETFRKFQTHEISLWITEVAIPMNTKDRTGDSD